MCRTIYFEAQKRVGLQIILNEAFQSRYIYGSLHFEASRVWKIDNLWSFVEHGLHEKDLVVWGTKKKSIFELVRFSVRTKAPSAQIIFHFVVVWIYLRLFGICSFRSLLIRHPSLAFLSTLVVTSWLFRVAFRPWLLFLC